MYLIQAKTKEMKKFMLLDVHAGVCVRLGFYATMFNSLEEAEDCIKMLSGINPDIKFKVKKT